METKRTKLRRFTLADLPYMQEMESDDEVMRYTSVGQGLPLEKIKERLEKLIESERKHHPLGVWAAELIDNQDLVGWFMLRRHRSEEAELGYMIRKKYWGQGFASEVAQHLVNFGLNEIGDDFISALTSQENGASIRVLQKVGFQLERLVEIEERGLKVELNYFRVYKS